MRRDIRTGVLLCILFAGLGLAVSLLAMLYVEWIARDPEIEPSVGQQQELLASSPAWPPASGHIIIRLDHTIYGVQADGSRVWEIKQHRRDTPLEIAVPLRGGWHISLTGATVGSRIS